MCNTQPSRRHACHPANVEVSARSDAACDALFGIFIWQRQSTHIGETSDQVVLKNGTEADAAITNFFDGFVRPLVGELLNDRLDVICCSEVEHGSHLIV
jgi:hypothetical protein